MELFKNHKLVKIFQKEDYEIDRAINIYGPKEKTKNTYCICENVSNHGDIDWIMIAILILLEN